MPPLLHSPSIAQVYERNQEATIYVGNLDAAVTENILAELFTQCGPVKNVHMPRDKITGAHQGYGFVEMHNEADTEYAQKVLHMVMLFGKPLRANKASQDKRTAEIGANLFVGNLDEEVDDKMLHDTFSAFGLVTSARVMRDPDTGMSKGYGFVTYDSFEASDNALASMAGQFLCNRPVHVSYAYKKDTRGQRHGSAAERLLAANRPSEHGLHPHFANPFIHFTGAKMPGVVDSNAHKPNFVPPSVIMNMQPNFEAPTNMMNMGHVPATYNPPDIPPGMGFGPH